MTPIWTFVSLILFFDALRNILSYSSDDVDLSDIHIFLENFNEKYFGIVSKKSDTDDSFYLYGTLVRVIDQETFFTSLFQRNYIEF